ncbi:hypothetical protein J7E78_01540 [Paenibacillus polymyxa]|uniref:hypothetical protein n=1 Tax=Paenibacillus polymyxa TaxID=1406 RepID=UPI001BE85BEC|nr:hypothetical protein [Paenibacillus polymyxa]MBT2282235.1 hypothetical protein [Paenibacillus polymyxa]
MLNLVKGIVDIGRIDGPAKNSIQGLVKEGTTFSNFSLFGKEWYINGDGVNRGGQGIYQQLGLKAPDYV